MTYDKPDPAVSLWWDWRQENGQIVRVCYDQTHKKWPWSSVERYYNPAAVNYAGKWKPVPLSEF